MTERICQWDDDCGSVARFKVRGGGIDGHYWFCARHYDEYIERQRCSPAEAWKWDAIGDAGGYSSGGKLRRIKSAIGSAHQ
jgi:hypothetical protein